VLGSVLAFQVVVINPVLQEPEGVVDILPLLLVAVTLTASAFPISLVPTVYALAVAPVPVALVQEPVVGGVIR
jgi:hypothetical protein